MLNRLHLTARQWRGILKWTLYSLFFVFILLLQTIVFAKLPIFGAKLTLVPIVIVCICIREGPEKGAFFALLASVFWCLSGADYGSISIAVLTFCGVLSSALCIAVLAKRFLPAALCCFVSLLLNELFVFLFKMIFGSVAMSNLWRVLLPGAVMSMVFYPLIYLVVKAISGTGGNDGV